MNTWTPLGLVMALPQAVWPNRIKNGKQGSGTMWGWVNLDREQLREIARILVPGIIAVAIGLVLLTWI